MSEAVDCVIVGGGVAGLSAALFLARAGRSTMVYDAGRPRIFAVDRVREFPGFDGASPAQMLSCIRNEALQYGADVRNGYVSRIEPREDGLFDVRSVDDIITSRTVILATGLIDERPRLSGVPEVWGRDLRVCPCFDGYEVRDGRFVVFGIRERLALLGSWVRMWSPHVTVISSGGFDSPSEKRLRLLGVEIVRDEVTGLIHDGTRLVAVSTASGSAVACDATWLAMPFKAASNLAASLCEVDEHGFAKTDLDGRTTRPGLFAIGNAADPMAHLAHAAAAGTRVGPVVSMYLLESLVRRLQHAECYLEENLTRDVL